MPSGTGFPRSQEWDDDPALDASGSDDGGRAGGGGWTGSATGMSRPGPDESGDFEPFTAEEAGGDPRGRGLMSCWPWRRPPPGGGARASPAPARGLPRPVGQPGRPGSAPGCRWTCCPAARALAVAADAARGARTAGSPASRRLSWPGGGVARGTGSRPTPAAPQARRHRRAGPPQPPPPGDAGFHRRSGSRTRWGSPAGRGRRPGRPGPRPWQARLARHRPRALDDGTISRYKAEDHRPRHRPCSMDAGARAAEQKVLDRAAPG